MNITVTRPSIGFPVDLFDLMHTDVQSPRPRMTSARGSTRGWAGANDPTIPPPRAEEDEERWDGLS